jgi:septal ring factor EnvC (AmiA/AmiB activator)
MGSAAYRRGSKLVREQIDVDQAANQPSALKVAIEAQSQQFAEAKAKVEKLETDLLTVRNAYARRNAEAKALKLEIQELRAEVKRLQEVDANQSKRLKEMRRRWLVASGVLRNQFSSEDIDRMKEEVYQQHPELRRNDSTT